MNALQLCAEGFDTKKPCSRLSARKAQFFNTKYGKFSLLRPLWGVRGNVRCSSWLVRKLVVDFLLVIIELFRWVLSFCHNSCNAFDGQRDGQTDRRTDGFILARPRCIQCSAVKIKANCDQSRVSVLIRMSWMDNYGIKSP